ncbi:MAG TPA: peptidylprolyl isomerase [Bacteroidetes bacterium]|nr:peptidylprolyl isomerase [Bacteroidota bacterium]HEX03613.1 peptidylprolyl isomerase [Bacteroidota bacterium]
METSLGEVVLGFYPDVAPNHVANFKRLATEDVYDNVLFHRVIPGFMVQTGDPGTADPDTPRNMYGMGGTDRNEPLMAEFSDTKHVRGTLAMARSKDPNSADSQFYIALNAVPHLDGSYTVFGQVLRGMEVIDSIAAVKTDMGDCPLEPIRIIDVKIMTKAEAGIE